MKKLFSKKLISILFSSFVGILLTIVLIPLVPKVFATNDFTASNITFDPATGVLEFDYTGTTMTTSSPYH